MKKTIAALVVLAFGAASGMVLAGDQQKKPETAAQKKDKRAETEMTKPAGAPAANKKARGGSKKKSN